MVIDRVPILILMLATQTACTSTRVGSELATGFQWAGLRSHTDIASTTRWQIPSGSSIRLEAIDDSLSPVWISAAEEGVYQVFPAVPADARADLLLRVDWPADATAPPEQTGLWHHLGDALPGTRDRVRMRLFLCDAGTGRVIQSSALTVDPHWFSPGTARPDQLRDAFQVHAESLSSRH